MVRAWIEEEPHELEAPEALLAETEASIARWNAEGRSLCTAFLTAVRAVRSDQSAAVTSSTTSSAANA